jgi:uncharacterized protein (DUF2147 family)
MLKRHYLNILFFLIAFSARLCSFAQTDPIERLWYNEEKTAKIQVYKATDGQFYGKIVWLKEPLRDGKPKIDINNTDKTRRNDPILGLVILKNLKKKSDNHYEEGFVYDPKNGKTYHCKVLLQGNKLDLRGYIGFSLIGRTSTWTRAD